MTNNHYLCTCYGRKLSIHVPFLLFVCGAVIVCLLLAHWQWQRAQAAEQRYQQYQQQSLLPATLLSADLADYQRVTVTGTIRQLLYLDNQILNSRAGYHVLAEVTTHIDPLLVNLGWQPKSRERLDIHTLPEQITVHGLIKRPDPGLMLQAATADPGWPQLLQQIDIGLLSQHFGYPLLPYVVHAESSFNELIAVPVAMENKYHMHFGYAIQWLIIAAVFMVGFVCYSLTGKTADDY